MLLLTLPVTICLCASDSSDTNLTSASSQVSETTPINSKKRTPEEKLDSLVLTDVIFENNTISEALTIVRKLSMQADPDGQGVDFDLQLREDHPFNGKITTHLKTPTLRTALNAIATQYNLKLLPERYGIALLIKE